MNNWFLIFNGTYQHATIVNTIDSKQSITSKAKVKKQRKKKKCHSISKRILK